MDKNFLFFLFLKSVEKRAIFIPKLCDGNPMVILDFGFKIPSKANKILSLRTWSRDVESYF